MCWITVAGYPRARGLPISAWQPGFTARRERYTVVATRFRAIWRASIEKDWITLVLVLLLIASLLAFFTGVFPYPYGWIVLIVLLAMRWSAKQKKE